MPIDKIETIFRRRIARHINTVVKVEQEDREIVQQELEEYILTGSLEKNYYEILEKILDTKNIETDETGLWISGFFGSGKSHFMKMLGYILENRSLPSGDLASDIFKQRTEDEMLKASIDAINNKFDSEVLMFQIGSKENKDKTESITDIILREFNKKQGYAETPWVAEIEKDLAGAGLYEDFKKAIENITGDSWEVKRTEATFVSGFIKKALVAIDSEFETKEDAGEAIQNVKDSLIINSEKLAEGINEYIMQKDAPEDQRFFVFLDEISQFIGDDEKKLLELQSVVEDFGRIGKGKIWLGVTSQEKLKELVPGILAQQDQVSKVLDRFKTRTNLTSEEIDRVVRERVLKKSEEAYPELENFYQTHTGILRVQYTLDSTRHVEPLDEESFVQCYPFLPYQLNILPNIFAGLRGKSGEDQLTGRERTMIDVIHSIFNEPTNFKERKIGELITLDLVFEEIKEEIPDEDVSTIENVSLKDGKNEFAKKVLKSLYLLQRLSWVPNTAKNISTSLYGSVGDTGKLDRDIKETLKKLKKAQYVGSDEEGYRFLSQTERGLMEEIEGVQIRSGDIKRKTKGILEDILEDLKTVNYSNNSVTTFDISIDVDKEPLSEKGDITLKVSSPIYQRTNQVDIRPLKTISHQHKDHVYWVCDETKGGELEEDIERVLKTEFTLNTKLGENLSREEEEAVGKKAQDNERLKSDIKKLFKESLKKGTVVYFGKDIELDGTYSNINECVKGSLNEAIPRVYTQLEDGLANVQDRDIERVFEGISGGSPPKSFEELDIYVNGNFNPNAPVCQKIEEEIKDKKRAGEHLTGKEFLEIFGSVPYGWPRNSVRIALAVLFRNGAVIPRYQERLYTDFEDAKGLFLNIRKFSKTIFEATETVPPKVRKKAKDNLNVLYDQRVKDTVSDVKNGIDDIVDSNVDKSQELIGELKSVGFPLTEDVEEYKELLKEIKEKKKSAEVIKAFVDSKGKLEEMSKTVKNLVEFKDSGRLQDYKVFKRFLDNDLKKITDLSPPNRYLEDEVLDVVERLDNSLMSKQVIDNWTEVQTDHNKVANAYKRSYLEFYNERMKVYKRAIEEVKSYGEGVDELESIISELKNRVGKENVDVNIDRGEHIGLTPSIQRLDEHIRTVDSYIDEAKGKIDELREEDEDEIRFVTIPITDVLSGTVVKDENDLKEVLSKIEKKIREELDSDEETEIRFR